MCTGISLGNKDLGINTLSRTLDFVFMEEGEMVVLPRNFTWKSLADDKEYSAKYSMCGMGSNVANYMFNEGLNEKGLAGAMLYLPGFAKYNNELSNDKMNIAPFEILKYFLTQCSDVKEVIESAKTMHVMDVKIPQFDMELPVHFILSDKNGETVIIETVGCEIKIYEENVGVMTNSPSYDWHMNNLANYLNFSRNNPSATINGVELAPKGEGFGLHLPGGVNPMDRFVRAAIGRELMVSKGLITNQQECILHAFKLLDNVCIPKGYMDMQGQCDYSIYKICMSCNELKYYYKTYKTDTLTVFDFNKYIDATEPMQFPLINDFIVQEM